MSFFLSFFSILGLPISAVLLTIFSTICSTHQTLTMYQNIPDHIFDSTLDQIANNYNIRHYIKTFHRICYPTSSSIPMTLRPVLYILQYSGSTPVTLRHVFLSWGMSDHISDSISSSTCGQCINIMIARGE